MAERNPDKLYDVVVVGGGPAGLTAALYLARARYRVLVIEKEHFGGQITITSEVVNYPGVFKTSGSQLTETMRKQAESFGAEFLLAEVEKLETEGEIKAVHTSRGSFSCFGILIATGAHPRMLGFQGEAEFKGHGVAYCATCDGEFFTGKEVFVIGGGFAAAEEGVFLTKYASHVTIMMRGNDFSCAETVARKAKEHDKITVMNRTQIVSVDGDAGLHTLRYKNLDTDEVTEYKAAQGDSFGVFVFAGYEPETSLLQGIADLNEQGYVITDHTQQTSVEGVYAAGDVCVKNLRQVVTAVGDGAIAATELEKYAARMQQKTGIRPQLREIVRTEKAAEEAPAENAKADGLFSADMLAQLNSVFDKMETPLVLKVFTDHREVSGELTGYMQELARVTDKLSVEIIDQHTEAEAPCVRIYKNGEDTGLAFHGVPGGHEFTSFVLGLYNASGPGQALEEDVKQAMEEISREISLKVMISLSCTMCPELVTAAQRIAAANPLVRAEVYDLNHFPSYKDKYKVMSVPCLVINDQDVSFGKKNIRQLLELIR